MEVWTRQDDVEISISVLGDVERGEKNERKKKKSGREREMQVSVNHQVNKQRTVLQAQPYIKPQNTP